MGYQSAAIPCNGLDEAPMTGSGRTCTCLGGRETDRPAQGSLDGALVVATVHSVFLRS